MLAVVALAVAAWTGVAVVRSGAVTPRIEVDWGWDAHWEYSDTSRQPLQHGVPVTTHVSQGLVIVNAGWYPVEIVGVDVDRPGMRVERVAVGSTHFDERRGFWRTGGADLTADRPYVLAPDERLAVTIYYDVTDCAAVPATSQRIPLRLTRWFGRQSVQLSLPPLRPYANGWSVSRHDDPKAVQWQRFLADHVCQIRYPDAPDRQPWPLGSID